MKFSFDPKRSLILVKAEIYGPSGSTVVSLALDTGASVTSINQSRLIQLGYDPVGNPRRFQIVTASGTEFVARSKINKLVSLGIERRSFPVLFHNLPPSSRLDGLLGLDFLRGKKLVIDLKNGEIDVT